MASDTNTKKTKDQRSSFDKLMDLYWGGTERRISALTLRIIGINALSLIVLMLGIFNLGQYESELLTTKLSAFQRESSLITDVISLTPPEKTPELIEFLSLTSNQQITQIAPDGKIIYQAGSIDERKGTKKISTSLKTLRSMAGLVLKLLPERKTLPTLPENITERSDVETTLTQNTEAIAAWSNNQYPLALTATVPLYRNSQMVGAIHFTRAGDDITQGIAAFWGEMLKIFLITLLITIAISIYLSGTIARPLRKLMRAAEKLRRNRPDQAEIPDLSTRHDEIGELSLVMRDMTESLRTRISGIESFAADVTHELKNPLTSLKSAVETLKIAKKKKDQQALLDVLQHDIERMDRLITDIAATSRLDTELSRQPLERVDLTTILKDITHRYNAQTPHITITLNTPYSPQQVWVSGFSGRLMQVFDNILSNAISFAQDDDEITITLQVAGDTTKIIIEDQGPGIPEEKLGTIFERFYSKRPEKEDFGRHSGLGLAICKQIIAAVNGDIKAENIKSAQGKTIGARFIVKLNTI